MIDMITIDDRSMKKLDPQGGTVETVATTTQRRNRANQEASGPGLMAHLHCGAGK